MIFTDLQNVCRYSASAYTKDKDIIDVCRNPKAKLQVGFWGLCDAEHCPLNDNCTFDDIGYLGELSCSECGAVIGTAADTAKMRFCPYCGKERKNV